MPKYVYKGFDIYYEIDASKELYEATGYAGLARGKSKSESMQKFHTESTNSAQAKKEIKKLIEDYIDFEWKKYYEMQNS